jgi:3-dehydroquinate synthase
LNDSHTVDLGAQAYPVYFRTHAREELGARLSAVASHRRLVVVTDTTVDALHGRPLRETLAAAGLTTTWLAVPPGEASKSVAQASHLWDAALAAGIDRRTPIVAFGGGVVGDLAGFVASTLLRGLPFVQVPTTLMAQVDSSVGGKTALDHALGKNLIGTFHQPRFVFIDTGYLETLDERQRRSGLAEVVKHGALAEPALLEAVCRPEVQTGDAVVLRGIVERAVRIKAGIVADDEREAGLRMVLNFGHTLGHALEAAAEGALTHGEAVSLGMVAALRLSERRAGLAPSAAVRVEAALETVALPTDWGRRFDEAARSHLAHDKKARGDRLSVVLLQALGEPAVVPIHLTDYIETLTALAAENARKTP